MEFNIQDISNIFKNINHIGSNTPGYDYSFNVFDEEIGLTIREKPYRNCPNCNNSNKKEESCNKYVCKYCSGD